jgi:hypothetical protein
MVNVSRRCIGFELGPPEKTIAISAIAYTICNKFVDTWHHSEICN